MAQVAKVLDACYKSKERDDFLNSLLKPVTSFYYSFCYNYYVTLLQGAMRSWSGASTSYWKLRDSLMAETVLQGGANRGEILLKLTLSVKMI